MKLTLDQYINNPMGKGPLYNGNVREAVKKNYTERWWLLFLRENGKIKHTFYHDKKNNVYYCHFKIPSETVRTIYYDVVFRFFTDSNVEEAGTNLFKYNVQFFSNDPAFTFYYANAFYNNDLCIKDLHGHMSRKAIKEKAKEKNPGGYTGYVKTFYFAYLYMRDKGLWNTNGHTEDLPYDRRMLLKNVVDTDTMVENRQEEGAKHTKKKVKENREHNRDVMARSLGNSYISNISSTKKVKKVRGSAGVSSTKKIHKK